MAAVKSKIAGEMLSSLLDLDPPTRTTFLTALPETDYLAVIRAAETEMGSPFSLWHDDLEGFITLGLGETLWSLQAEIGRAIVDHDRLVVPAAHSTGKTWLLARIVAWFIMTRPFGTAVAVTTAPKFEQLELGVWPDIRQLHEKARLPGRCLQTRWWMGDPERPVAFGRSPKDNDETGFSGIHAPYVLALVEEAGGFSPVLLQSLENLASGGYFRLVLVGNPPIDETGSAVLEDSAAKPSYHLLPIPADRTPNFTGEKTPLCAVHPDLPPHPISDHLISRKWVEDVKADFGEDDPYYIARVLAQFPKDLQAKIIPFTWLEASKANTTPDDSTWVRLGVDIASDGGDEFVIARAEGYTVRIVDHARGATLSNAYDVAARILTAIEAAQAKARELGSVRKVRVKIDRDGIGWMVSDTLKAWGTEGRHAAEIVGLRHGTKCASKLGQEKYGNKRAEMWWNGRELSQPKADDDGNLAPTWRLELDDQTLRQLSAPMRSSDTSGRFLAESKEHMKKRGLSSPDRADAVLLSVYEPFGSGQARITVPTGKVPRPR